MPIRFRCVYCDKLLGIARRKAGAVVNCPQCGQPLIVPTPEPEPEPQTAAAPHGATAASPRPVPAPPPPAPNKLFERDDFDVLLEPDATFRSPNPPPAPPRKPKPASPRPPNPLPPQPFALEDHLPAPPQGFPTVPQTSTQRPAKSGIVISSGMLFLALIAVLGLMGLAFGGGVLVGKMLTAGG